MPNKYLLTVKTSNGKEKKIAWDKETDPSQEEVDSLPEYVTPKAETKPSFLGDVWDETKNLGSGLLQLGKDLVWSTPSEDGSHLTKSGRGYVDTIKKGIEDTKAAANSPIGNPVIKGMDVLGHAASVPFDVVGLPVRQTADAIVEGRPGKAAVRGLLSLAGGKELVSPRIKPEEGFESRVKAPTIEIPKQYDSPIGPQQVRSFEGITPGELNPRRSPGNIEVKLPEGVEGPKQLIKEAPLTSNPKINFDDLMQQGLDLPFDPTGEQPNLPYRHYKERYGDRYDITGPQQPELFDVINANQSIVQRPMIPSSLEPRVAGLDRPTWSRFAEQRALPFEYDTLSQAESSGIPEIQKAVAQLVQKESTTIKPNETTFSRTGGYQNPNKQQSNISKVKDNIFTSNDTVLRRDSPAGGRIMDSITKYRTEVGRISGSISAAIKDVVEPLNPSQRTEWQTLLDEGGVSRDPMVNNALTVARDIDTNFTQRATQSGLHLKTADGQLVPFTGKENYWPRMYDPSLFKDKPALIQRLIKNGLSPEAAKKAVDNIRRFGERLIDPQNARILDLPEHRKDLGALLKHYDDMSHRVVAAEEFGVKDIADPESAISQLVSQTKDQSRITKILTQYLDRDTGVEPHDADVAKKISKVATAYYLSKFAISNANQIAMVPIVTNFKSTSKAVGQFIKSPKKTWREAEATGALQTVMQEAMREVGGESLQSKMYGIKASEGSNRTIAAIAGKHYSIDLFNKAKKGNVAAQKSLSDLTLKPWDELARQDSLTDENIAYAASRVTEKTQGRAQSIDLPYGWSKSPYIGLLTLYKKYAFVQNKLMKEALKADPNKPLFSKEGGVNINPKNAVLLMGLFQLTGEATGDIKAIIKGAITGDPGQQVEDRGQSWDTGNKVLNRTIQNYTDSMFLGLIGDAAQSVRGGKWGMANALAGPIIAAPIELAGNIQSDIKNRKAITNHPSKSSTLRGLASHIPYAGSSVYNWMKEP